MKIWGLLKRLLLAVLVVALASGALLLSDLDNRKPSLNKLDGAVTPGRIYKIGVVYFAPDPSNDNVLNGLFDGLAKRGFVKDKNLNVRLIHANAEIPNIPSVLQSMDNSDVDMIISLSTPCLSAAIKSVKHKPLVFSFVTDPVAAGAGKSLTEHLPNLTGVGSFPSLPETVELIKKMLPGIRSVGVLYNSSEINSFKVLSEARKIFAAEKIRLVEVTVTNTNEVLQASQVLAAKKIEAIWLTVDNTSVLAFDSIAKTALKHKLPIIANDTESLDRGAVAAVGVGWYGVGVRTADIAADVLLGAKTSEIPMQNFAERRILLNEKQAKRIGLHFNDAVRAMVQQSAVTKLLKKARICLLQYSVSPLSEDTKTGVIEGFREAGLVEGTDFDLKYYNANGDIATLTAMLDNVLADKYDVIIVSSTPTLQAAIKKIKKTPIVFTSVADPIIAGAGKSFTNHLPNVTGISTLGDFETFVKMVKAIQPDIKTVGTLYTPSEVNSVKNLEIFKKYAAENGLVVRAIPIFSSNEVSDAANALYSKKIEAVTQIIDNNIDSSFVTLINTARRLRVPIYGMNSKHAAEGAVATVARDYVQAGKDAVRLTLRIINGKNPNNIPFELTSKTVIILNRNAAGVYSLRFPPDVVKRAGRIIGDVK